MPTANNNPNPTQSLKERLLIVVVIVGFFFLGLLLYQSHSNCHIRWLQTEVKLNQTIADQEKLVSITEKIVDYLQNKSDTK